jgi:hypothetical protein
MPVMIFHSMLHRLFINFYLFIVSPSKDCNSGLTSFSIGEISGSHGGKYEDIFFGMLRRVVWQKLTDISKVLIASIFKASETSVIFCQTTRRNIHRRQ